MNKARLPRHLVAALLIVFAALILRLQYLTVTPFPPPEGDAWFYHLMAQQIVRDKIIAYNSSYPNAYVTPGYPLFLAAVYKITGSSVQHAMVVQAILSAVTVLLVYYLASQFLRPLFALIATALAAIYPPFIYANGLLLTEVTFTFFFMLSVCMLTSATLKRHTSSLIASGFLMGITLLIRPTPFLLIPLLLYYSSLCLQNVRQKIKWVALFTLTMTLVLAPWWIRNYLLYGHLILFSTSGTNPLLWGVHPYYIGVPQTFDAIYSQHPTELERYHIWSHEAKRLATNFFHADPGAYLKWFLLGKISYLWNKPWIEDGRLATCLGSIRQSMHLVLVAGGWLGVLASALSGNLALNLAAVIPLYYTIFHICLMGLPRYAFPVMPFMIILASFFAEVTCFALGRALRRLR